MGIQMKNSLIHKYENHFISTKSEKIITIFNPWQKKRKQLNRFWHSHSSIRNQFNCTKQYTILSECKKFQSNFIQSITEHNY